MLGNFNNYYCINKNKLNMKNAVVLFITILSLSNFSISNPIPHKMEKEKIIYVYDPMCGWCFGFGKVMEQFFEEYKDTFDFDVISGGMNVGEREGEVGDFADYILGAYTRVEEYSGMKFGESYLAQLRTKKLWLSSVKPSIALEVFKSFNKKDVVHFSHQIQKAFFINGTDLREDNVYKDLIKPYQIPEKEFIEKLKSEEFRKSATDGFQTAANWGVTGYPMVIYIHNNTYYAIAKGFTDLKTLKETLKKVQAK